MAVDCLQGYPSALAADYDCRAQRYSVMECRRGAWFGAFQWDAFGAKVMHVSAAGEAAVFHLNFWWFYDTLCGAL